MAAAGAPDIEDADKVSFECVYRGNEGAAGGAQACGATRCLGRRCHYMYFCKEEHLSARSRRWVSLVVLALRVSCFP